MRNLIYYVSPILFFLSFQTGMARPSDPALLLADSLIQAEDYQQAEALLLTAKPAFFQREQYENYIQTFAKLVRLYEAQGRREEQFTAIEDGLAEGVKYLPPNAAVIGSLKMMQGEFRVGQGEIAQGLEALNQGQEILRQSDDFVDLTWCYSDLTIVHYYLDHLDSAQHYLELGQAVCDTHLPPRHEAFPTFLDLSTMIYTKRGNYEKGLEVSFKSAALKEAYFDSTGWDSIELGNTYNNIASSYFLKGDLPKATPYFQKALSLIQHCSIPRTGDLGKILNNLGTSYQKQGRQQEGISTLLLAREYLSEPADVATANESFYNLANLISMYIELGENAKAKPFLQEALATGRKWSFSLELPYRYGGDLYLAEAKFDSALSYYQASLEALTASGIQDNFKFAQIHHSMARIYLQQDQPDSTLAYLQKSIDNFSYDFESSPQAENPPPDGYFPDWRILNSMAMKGQVLQQKWKASLADTTLLRRAHETFLAGIAIFQQFRSGYASTGSKLDLTETGLPLFEGGITTYLDLFELTQDPSLPILAFQLAEQCKGMAILEAQWEAQAKGSTLITDTLREEERQLNLDLAFYRNKIQLEERKGPKTDSLKLETWNNIVFEREQSLEAWEETVKAAFPTFLNFRNRKAEITPKQIRETILGPEEGMVEYFVGQQEIIAFYIDQESIIAYRTPKPTQFVHQTNQLYRCLSDFDYIMDSVDRNFEEFTRLGHALYTLTLGKVLSDHTDISKLLIISDGILHQIPFETLLTHPVDPDQVDFLNLPYLIHQYQIRYGYSASLLLETHNRKRKAKQRGLLAFAPAYPGTNLIASRGDLSVLRDQLGNLPGALNEVQSIAKLGLEGQFFYGPEANEAQFKQLAQEYPILHLAMHGTADETNPLYSYLSFGEQRPQSKEDQTLYAYELQALSLEAELTVLSACESGWGKLRPGEGVMSLGRSFMTSGTRSVLMTLWKINDQNSASLMEKFYGHLNEGKYTSESLHLAKKEFLCEADSRTAHPFFWAAFISQGDSQPLPKSNPYLIWLGIALAAIILGGCLYAFRKRRV